MIAAGLILGSLFAGTIATGVILPDATRSSELLRVWFIILCGGAEARARLRRIMDRRENAAPLVSPGNLRLTPHEAEQMRYKCVCDNTLHTWCLEFSCACGQAVRCHKTSYYDRVRVCRECGVL